MRRLKQLVEDHVEEEESGLFPEVRRIFGREVLDSMGDQMQELMEDLQGRKEELRAQVPRQTDRPAPLD